MTTFLDRLKPWMYRSLLETYHDRPLPFLVGNVPTFGEGLYISVLLILNLVFLTVGYETLWPREEMQWYANHYQELLAYWMWRTGALAFCQMPLLFLFSTRNNILLWLTNWSHSTFMLLHRWVARFFLVQVLLHSIISLVLYVDDGAYSTQLHTPLWIWGCVATVAAVLIVLLSALVIRRRAYELFLVTHVVLAVICMVGCWYHVWYDDEGEFGYATWLYATFAVWFFDRLVRVGRILKTGCRRATVTVISPDIFRVDIPGIRWQAAGQCAYIYFPSLRRGYRPWENHPFSMIPTPALAGRSTAADNSADADIETDGVGKETKSRARVGPSSGRSCNAGTTFFIKRRGGMTASLGTQMHLLTLVEGPYPTTPQQSLLQSDRLVLIGGGIGITGLLPYLPFHPNIKLLYSVKTRDATLVTHLRPLLDQIREKEIRVGERLDIAALLEEDAEAGWSKIAVVACGPASMCDNTRATVSRLGRTRAGGCSFELAVDAFSW
jgi:predicted ferric reductase